MYDKVTVEQAVFSEWRRLRASPPQLEAQASSEESKLEHMSAHHEAPSHSAHLDTVHDVCGQEE